MKYRISGFSIYKKPHKSHTLRAKERNITALTVLLPICSSRTYKNIKLDLDLLFELSALPEPKKPKRIITVASFFNRLISAISGFLKRVGTAICRSTVYFFRRRPAKNPRLAFFSGVLCSAVLSALLSVAVVLATLFGGFLLPYDELITPSLVGESYSASEAYLSAHYDIVISYENSNSVPAGDIISQKPDAGIVRKVYSEPPRLSLTVSLGKSFYEVEDFIGAELRPTLLSLQNSGIAVKIEEQYSDTSPEGTVISTFPSKGKALYSGEFLTLTVSLGKKTLTVRVPELYGLSESQASAMLASRSLLLGAITYKPSTLPAGRVIEQQYAPYSTLPEGSSVSITVSLGNTTQKYVPDLYGLDIEAARTKLAEVGLVIGRVYSVSGALPGSILMQTPAPKTPITSSLTAVDIYICD